MLSMCSACTCVYECVSVELVSKQVKFSDQSFYLCPKGGTDKDKYSDIRLLNSTLLRIEPFEEITGKGLSGAIRC